MASLYHQQHRMSAEKRRMYPAAPGNPLPSHAMIGPDFSHNASTIHPTGNGSAGGQTETHALLRDIVSEYVGDEHGPSATATASLSSGPHTAPRSRQGSPSRTAKLVRPRIAYRLAAQCAVVPLRLSPGCSET